MSADDNKPFDPFELAAAILLGIGAIGTAVAGHQSGLWGGQSVEAYGEAAALTTKASSTYNDELTTYMQDTQVDIRAKELIWEGSESEDDAAGERQLGMASWMLITQTSDAAYKFLGLPEAKRKAYWEWVTPLQKQGLCKEIWARTGRGAIALQARPRHGAYRGRGDQPAGRGRREHQGHEPHWSPPP